MALMHDVDAGARWAPALRALPDERLARMVEHGNDSAFSAIYARYSPVLHGYCRSLLRDEEEAGDALQNAMLKAMQAMRKASRTGPLRPWLFRIAHNESITIIRQRSRRPGVLEDNLVAGEADAFRQAAAREDLAALLRDLETLTQYQRSALVMRELGGLSYDEIASALDTTPLAARQAVFAAKRKLDPEKSAVPRKRLKLLLPPAPAGFALLSGLFGGGGTGLVAKTVITAAAVSALGVGSVEVVTNRVGGLHQGSDKHRTATVAKVERPSRRSASRRAAVATTTATPAAAARKARAAAATATPTTVAVSVGGRRLGASVARSAATATSTATPVHETVLSDDPVATPTETPGPSGTPDGGAPVSRPTGTDQPTAGQPVGRPGPQQHLQQQPPAQQAPAQQQPPSAPVATATAAPVQPGQPVWPNAGGGQWTRSQHGFGWLGNTDGASADGAPVGPHQ